MWTPQINSAIQQKLDQIQQDVLKAKHLVKNLWIGVGIGGAILFILGAVFQNPVFFYAAFAGAIPSGFYTFHKLKQSTDAFKPTILSPLINNDETENIAYNPIGHITSGEFSYSEIFKRQIDRFSGEDLFSGYRDKVYFKFSEIKAEEKHESTDSNGHRTTSYETIFEGLFFIAKFNKKLQTLTRVIEARDSFFEKLFSGSSKVSLENPNFEKVFNTYSSNQVEARYILTPDLMERILELRKHFKAEVNLSFKDQYVLIAFETRKNFFELDDSPINEKQIERIFAEINHCLQIVDILDLNTRIWGV